MPWPTRSTRRAELPADWPAIRTRILRRDRYQCQARWADGQPCHQPANQCDHIGDRHNHDDSNLQALCEWHHKQKTARQGAHARPTERRTPEPHPGLQ